MRISLLCIVLLQSCLTLFAQNDPQAKQYLDKVSQKYRAFSSLEADFVLTIDADKHTETQSGKLYTKASQYKFTSTALDRWSDGKSVWTYLKPQKEIQVNTLDAAEITPNRLFNLYTKGYTYTINTEVKRGANQVVVDLIPTSKKDAPYFKVRLYVDKTTNLLNKAILFEKSGTRYTYQLNNQRSNTLKSNALFTFDAAKYAGVEVVDLR